MLQPFFLPRSDHIKNSTAKAGGWKGECCDVSRMLGSAFKLAAGLGLEPRYYAPEAYVLPLDDPAITPEK